jgi:hypothetical protein
LLGTALRQTAKTVYWQELRPVLSMGAEVMDNVFKIS